jgi:hypothetical protein
MLFINTLDTTTNKTWQETFDSEYFCRRRLNKLKYSKKLKVTSRGCYASY